MLTRSSFAALVAVGLASCDKGQPPSATETKPVAEAKPSATPAPPDPQPKPAAAPAADTGLGEVAFKTFEADGKRIVFTTPTKAKITWRNMVGKAVEGTYTQNGKEIEIQWDPAADNIGARSEKFRQMGPCSLARYERVDKAGKVHDDSPKIYQQTKPKCDTVRITQ